MYFLFIFSPRSPVPPRPPSKRNPERAIFPEKDGDFYEPLPGYCEICKVDYPDLKQHCQTDSHREYSMNADNYAQLDSRINSQALTAEALVNIFPPAR